MLMSIYATMKLPSYIYNSELQIKDILQNNSFITISTNWYWKNIVYIHYQLL